MEDFFSQFRSPHTKAAYARNVQRFLTWLGGEDNLRNLTAGELERYLAFLSSEGYDPASIGQHLSSVKAYLKWAARQRKISASVYAEALTVEGPKLDRKLPRPLKPAEISRLLDSFQLDSFAGARDYAFVRLALSTGARLSELVEADIEHIDWERREFIVQGKGRKERVIFFDLEAAGALVYYLTLRGSPTRGPLFVSEQRGDRITGRYLQQMVKSQGEKVGIEGLTPHRFRHTWATNFLNRTKGNREALRVMLGHSDLKTSDIYAALATDVLREVYDQAFGEPPPGPLPARVGVPVPRG